MFTVKFMKFGPEGTDRPTHTENVMVRETNAVHVRLEHGKSVVQLGDAPDQTYEVTVGADECAYHKAYVMNEAGRTVETIT